jgi:hypothetical protein
VNITQPFTTNEQSQIMMKFIMEGEFWYFIILASFSNQYRKGFVSKATDITGH